MNEKKFAEYVATAIEEGFVEGADAFVADLTAKGVMHSDIQRQLDIFIGRSGTRFIPGIDQCDVTNVTSVGQYECNHRAFFSMITNKEVHFFRVDLTPQ